MKHIFRLSLVVMLLALLSVSGVGAQSERGTAGEQVSRGDSNTPANLRAAVAEQGALNVIVVLNVEQAGRMAFDQLSDDAQKAVIAQTQDALLGELGLGVFSTESTRDAANLTRYENFPLLALTADATQLDVLLSSRTVAAIQRDMFRAPSLLQTTGIIGMTGANGAWAQGADGEGQTVAIIDSGVESNHPQLPLKIISEACYGVTTTGNYNGTTFNSAPACPGGVNSTALGSGVPCTFSSENAANKNQCDHGTNVAGIVAAKSAASINGVAKESTLISIQVFSMINTPSAAAGQGCDNPATPSPQIEKQCILAADSSIIAGLDRVFALRTSFNIAAANLSLGSEIYSSQAACDAALPAYVTAVSQLTNAGIAVVASSGNEGRTDGINAPACITGMISVGATNDDDSIYLQSNASPFLSYMAPGSNVDTTDTGGIGDNVSGTSFSAPHVAGAIAALRSYNPNATLTQIKNALTTTGVDITETVGGQQRTYKRIQVDDALGALLVPDKPTLLAPANGDSFAATPITFEWTTGNHTETYRLIIYRPDNTRIVEQDFPHAECDLENNKCTVSITAAFLDDVTYKWDVNARKGGTGTRSDQSTFVFDTPGKPSLIAPTNNQLISAPTELAELSWGEVDLATDYQVNIVRADKKSIVILRETVTEASVCTDSVCTYNVPGSAQNQLKDDFEYIWYVVSSNTSGTSKSVERKFKADFPGAPVLVSPAIGGQFNAPADIALVWNDNPSVTTYNIRVKDMKTGKFAINQTLNRGTRELTCDSGTCTFTPDPSQYAKFVDNRNYQWWVVASNEFGTSTSEKRTFKAQFPAAPVLVSPIGGAITFDPATPLVWEVVDDAATYKVRLILVSTGKTVLNKTVTPEVDATCNADICSYVLSPTDQSKLKTAKTYRWLVIAQNAFGTTPSAKTTFKTQFPGKPVLQAPANNLKFTAASQLTTLTWTPAPGATTQSVTYRVRVFLSTNASNKLLDVVVTPGVDVTCDVTICTYTVPTTLQNKLKMGKDYKWWVQANASSGKSKSQTFLFKLRNN